MITRESIGKLNLNPRHWVIVSTVNINDTPHEIDMPRGKLYLSVVDKAQFTNNSSEKFTPTKFKRGVIVEVDGNEIKYTKDSVVESTG